MSVRPSPWVLGLAGAVVASVLALAALAVFTNPAQVEQWLSPLSALEQPVVEMTTANRADAAEGTEYVAFLKDDLTPAALDGFFRGHLAVRFVSAGLLPGVTVVRIRGDVPAGVAALRDQPEVRMVLKSRLGMVCH